MAIATPITVRIDAQDDHLLTDFRWYVRRDGYVCRKVDSTTHYLHRYITAAPKGLDVDHINGDPSDNRRTNLRVLSHSKNLRNRTKPSWGQSGFRNVYPTQQGYTVRLRINGRMTGFGRYRTAYEANLRAIELRQLHFPEATS